MLQPLAELPAQAAKKVLQPLAEWPAQGEKSGPAVGGAAAGSRSQQHPAVGRAAAGLAAARKAIGSAAARTEEREIYLDPTFPESPSRHDDRFRLLYKGLPSSSYWKPAKSALFGTKLSHYHLYDLVDVKDGPAHRSRETTPQTSVQPLAELQHQ